MEIYNQPHDLKVFGTRVKTFPKGIGEAFNTLIKILPQGNDRSFYGISECTKDGIIYNAAAEETFDGEAEKYDCEVYTIEQGEYLTITVKDWLTKTESIKDVFESFMRDERVDKTKPCVEWYKNDKEMCCMVKIDQTKI